MTRIDPKIQGEVRTGTLSASRAADAGEVLAASHADYPAFQILFGDRDRRRDILEVFMTATSRDAARHGLALAAEDDLGMLGVGLWMPPGTFPLTAVRKARMTPAMLRIGWRAPTALPRFARVGATLERSLPTEPVWYLQVLGVRPRGQRSGIGRRLMEPGLARADEARLPCHLHTSDPANIAYYQRFGFEVAQREILVGDDGPRYLSMTRPAT